jgi:hypothetical protein
LTELWRWLKSMFPCTQGSSREIRSLIWSLGLCRYHLISVCEGKRVRTS